MALDEGGGAAQPSRKRKKRRKSPAVVGEQVYGGSKAAKPAPKYSPPPRSTPSPKPQAVSNKSIPSAPSRPRSSRKPSVPQILGGYNWTDLGGEEAHSAKATHRIWQNMNAVDLGAPAGTPIHAVESGQVVGGFGPNSNSAGTIYGNRMTIINKDGVQFFYTHMGGYGDGIEPGARVKKGQLIGYVGEGPGGMPSHLHFAVSHGTASEWLKGSRKGKPKQFTPGTGSSPATGGSTGSSGSPAAAPSGGGQVLPHAANVEGSSEPLMGAQHFTVLPGDLQLDPSQVASLRTSRLIGGEQPGQLDAKQIAALWARLAAMPGASPETQALARMAQAAVQSDRRQARQRKRSSVREMERQSLNGS